MTNQTCPTCEARRERLMRVHHERMATLHEDYAERKACLNEQHEASVMRQAEWKQEQFDIIERLHAEHAGEGDV